MRDKAAAHHCQQAFSLPACLEDISEAHRDRAGAVRTCALAALTLTDSSASHCQLVQALSAPQQS